MNKTFAAFSLCLIVLATCVLAFRGSIRGALRGGIAGQQVKVVWEYKTIEVQTDANIHVDSKLDELGRQGWELAGVTTWSREGTARTILYFKRAK